jgi:2,3-bisphosphoglycerate-independent phosphoglycerate mutase
MFMTMDRYGADWEMVLRGWRCHVLGIGERFPSASDAVRELYERDESVNDQWLSGFVITDDSGEPNGLIESGDSVLFFNFRGDRAIEISRAFENRECGFDYPEPPPNLRCFAGMMSYDGDDCVPQRYLVNPPVIDDTLGQRMAASNRRSFVVAETQKFGHVTYFFNGNRSGYIDESLERYVEVPSDNVPFETAPAMKAVEVTDVACAAVLEGCWDHVRVNLANGDMVGHTGDIEATITAMEVVDDCVRELLSATANAGGVFVLTADHGNADEMFQWSSKKGDYKLDEDGATLVSTAHSKNRVPFVVVDFSGRYKLLVEVDDNGELGLPSIGSTILKMCGVAVPAGWSRPLVTKR